jgi:hypothetical protein
MHQLTIPYNYITTIKNGLAETRNDIARRAETDTQPWAPWSSYPIGRTDIERTPNAILARMLDDWTGTVVVSDYSTFLSLARGDSIPQFQNMTGLLSSIGRSVFVATPYLRNDNPLLGAIININDVEAPTSLGIGIFPLLRDSCNHAILWTVSTIKDIFNPYGALFNSDVDTVARVGVGLWAFAAHQARRGVPPQFHQPGLQIHTVQPTSALITSN